MRNDYMRKIEKNTWDRWEIYDFFSGISNPFYMVSFTVDVTELKAFTKKHDCSFYYSMIYLCCEALKSADNFLYSCRDGEIYLLEERMPSFTDRKPESELFHIVTLPAHGDILAFCKTAKEASSSQQGFIDMSHEGDDLAYFSCLPTLRMTALTNEFDLFSPGFAESNIPRISWGRYTENQGRLELTMSMEVNHRFVDGIHIEKFAAKLEALIAELE